jgi:hypothetical protein
VQGKGPQQTAKKEGGEERPRGERELEDERGIVGKEEGVPGMREGQGSSSVYKRWYTRKREKRGQGGKMRAGTQGGLWSDGKAPPRIPVAANNHTCFRAGFSGSVVAPEFLRAHKAAPRTTHQRNTPHIAPPTREEGRERGALGARAATKTEDREK